MQGTILSDFNVSTQQLNKILHELTEDYAARGIQLHQLASGYSFRSNDALSPFLSRLWQETAPRFSRALLETLALIAYRQPITRGEIEDVRGVAVSSNIIRTLTEREWVRVVGHKEVPGRPALYATTNRFLDYFGLKSLSDLPTEDAFDALLAEATEEQTPAAPANDDSHAQQDTQSTNKEQLH
jgi:segregation and condensation protein B